jgi:antitoxin component YwqK of YwqJK toxin-antitoxin module
MALKEIKTEFKHYFEDESGKKQGEYKLWHVNGQLREHCYYVDGNLHGEYKWWHLNGQLSQHCYYVDGKRHGEYKLWYSDGQPWVHCYFVDEKIVIDFCYEPEKYPTSEEAKTHFALKYGSGKWL